jgi:hypothetical protein
MFPFLPRKWVMWKGEDLVRSEKIVGYADVRFLYLL